MRYTMKSGILYRYDREPLVRLKGVFVGKEKRILNLDGSLILKTNIRDISGAPEKSDDLRFREYVMFDADGREYAVARPGYAKGDNPALVGWPIYRMPRVDHARLFLHEKEYLIVMESCQKYYLNTLTGNSAVQITHKGVVGGWRITSHMEFHPHELCGIFAFCRYIEQENEFLVV